jgi:hypothetical protein
VKVPGSYEDYYNNTIDKIVMTTTKAKSQGLGSDNLSEVAAAAAGKVDTLLIEAEPKFRA